MTDQLHSYRIAGKLFAAHDWVNHGNKEYVCGEVHNNTAESFNANLERAELGVFHYMSKKHLARYPPPSPPPPPMKYVLCGIIAFQN